MSGMLSTPWQDDLVCYKGCRSCSRPIYHLHMCAHPRHMAMCCYHWVGFLCCCMARTDSVLLSCIDLHWFLATSCAWHMVIALSRDYSCHQSKCSITSLSSSPSISILLCTLRTAKVVHVCHFPEGHQEIIKTLSWLLSAAP